MRPLTSTTRSSRRWGSPKASAPPGAHFHWAAETDDGIRVVDVWEEREAFDRFAEEQIGPYSREVGLEGAPSITYHEIHNTLRAA